MQFYKLKNQVVLLCWNHIARLELYQLSIASWIFYDNENFDSQFQYTLYF